MNSKLVGSCFVGILLVSVSYSLAQDNTSTRLQTCEKIMDDLAHRRVAAVRQRFAAQLKQVLSAEQMEAAWDQTTGQLGEFVKHDTATSRLVEGTRVYVVLANFEKGKAELRITFNDADDVSGIWIVPQSGQAPEKLQAAAKGIVDLLSQKKFAAVRSQFNSQMQSAFTEQQLAALWTQLLQTLGPFVQQQSAQKKAEFDIVDVLCHLQNGNAIVRISFDTTLKINGLWILPTA